MIMSNKQISNIIQNIGTYFDFNKMYLPINLDFALQSNLVLLSQKMSAIEYHYERICQHYGELSKQKNEYIFPLENIPLVEKELKSLYEIKQDIPIIMINLNDIEDIQLTVNQLNAISFMIEER